MVKALTKLSSTLLRERIHTAVLDCGLRVSVLPKKGFAQRIAIFATRYGSVDLAFTPPGRERLETPPGIAHFLEHQLFKKAGGEDVLMEFGRYGASSNAYTDYATTAYYFTSSAGFEPSLDLLVSFVSSPFFTADNVEKEKKIIEQELRMYDDSPDYRLYKNLMGALYTVHPVRLDIGGEVSDIMKIDRDLLEACYRMFYNPNNMNLVVAGDVDPEAVVRRVNAKLPPAKFRALGEIRRHWPEEPAGVGKEEVRQEMAVSRPRVLVGFKDLQAGAEGALDRELATSVVLDLVFGRSSDYYTRAYERGIIDDGFSFSYNSDDPYGFSLIGGETDTPEKLAGEIRAELRRARRRRFRKRDVERAKRKRLGGFLRSFDAPDGTAFLLLGCLPRGIDVFSIPKAIARLTPRILQERLEEHFVERNSAVSIVTPKGR